MNRGASAGIAGIVVGVLTLTACAQAPRELDTRAAAPPAASPTPQAASAEQPGTLLLLDDRIRESSGLAASAAYPGVLYTHNDRGHGPEIFAVGPDGHTRARLTLEAADAVDWEDIAVTPDGLIWIADIGDNDERRKSVSVYVADEPPHLVDGVLQWARYRFVYEDGPRDAEALMVDPATRQLYVISKAGRRAGIYEPSGPLRSESTNLLRRVTKAPRGVTAADFSADGAQFAMRTQRKVFIFSEVGTAPTVLDLPPSKQGESLAFATDGVSLLAGSEGANSRVSRIELPHHQAPETPKDDGQ